MCGPPVPKGFCGRVFLFWSRVPPCGLLIQKYLESGDGTPDEDASHERNCFRISMPKLQPDSVLASSYVSGCTFAVCRLISSVCVCVRVCDLLVSCTSSCFVHRPEFPVTLFLASIEHTPLCFQQHDFRAALGI